MQKSKQANAQNIFFSLNGYENILTRTRLALIFLLNLF